MRFLEEATTHSIIGGFFESYNTLGFGLREFLYAEAIARELRARGHHVQREAVVTVYYKGQVLGSQRVDMLVDRKIIVEIKSTFVLDKDATRQVYNYLRAAGLTVGLLLHFGPKPRFYRIEARGVAPP